MNPRWAGFIRSSKQVPCGKNSKLDQVATSKCQTVPFTLKTGWCSFPSTVLFQTSHSCLNKCYTMFSSVPTNLEVPNLQCLRSGWHMLIGSLMLIVKNLSMYTILYTYGLIGMFMIPILFCQWKCFNMVRLLLLPFDFAKIDTLLKFNRWEFEKLS